MASVALSRSELKAKLVSSPPALLHALRLLLVAPTRGYIRYAPWSAFKLALWNKVASHLWFLESNVDARTKFGDSLRVDATDIVGKYLYYFGLWEPCLTAWIRDRLKPGDTFIDVGSNIGYFTTLASRLVGPSGKVVAIEALPKIAKILAQNMARTGRTNMRELNVAAWNQYDSLTFFTRADRPSGTTTCLPSWASHWDLTESHKVPALPLQEVLTREEIVKARIVKIDVEGAEFQALQGMEAVFPHLREDVEFVIEVNFHGLENQGLTRQDFLSWFNKRGFHAYLMPNEYTVAPYLEKLEAPVLQPLSVQSTVGMDQVDVVFSRRAPGAPS